MSTAIELQDAPAEAELDELDRDEADAQELVLPEAPGNSSDSDDEGCVAILLGSNFRHCGVGCRPRPSRSCCMQYGRTPLQSSSHCNLGAHVRLRRCTGSTTR